MYKGVLACLAVLLATGLALAQSQPEPAGPAPPSAAEAPLPPGDEPAPEAGSSDAASLAAHRFWVRSEYLLWWVKDGQAPVLVTTGNPADHRPGALGMPGTTALFDGDLDYKERSGGRFMADLWLDDHQEVGLEAGYFFLGTRSARFTAEAADAPGAAVVARPFFDVLSDRQDSSLVALPGLAGGSVTVTAPSYLQGAEANLVGGLWQGEACRVELLAGFRYLNLHEDLDVGESVQVDPAAPLLAGDAITVADHFDARNNYYGGQLGLRTTFRYARWDLETVAKVALGDTHEVVTISGATSITPPGGPARSSAGGLLALPSNSGRFSHDAFAVVPEAGVNLSYRLTRWLRAYVGYTFVYCSDVVRPGEQVDVGLNREQIATSRIVRPRIGPDQPAFSFAGTDFWAQGINFGLEVRY